MKYIKLALLAIGILTTSLILMSGNCLPTQKWQTKGVFFNRPFASVLDNVLAKAFIEQGNNSEKVQLLTTEADKKTLDNALMRDLTKQSSADFATLYALGRLYEQPQNRMAQNLYAQYNEALTKKATLSVDEMKEMSNYLFVFVPGFAYKEDTTTGADFGRQRRLFEQNGFKTHLIETEEWGLASKNAQIVASVLRDLCFKNNKIIVVSASKGGLETAIALGSILTPVESQNIKSWISVGGILRGSPIADQYLCAPKSWFAATMLAFKGQNLETVRDMSYKKRANDDQLWHFPPNILRLHFIGAPLATQISAEIRSRYCSLIKNFGPNDGLTTLTDQITEGGTVVSELGLDHYYKDENIDTKTVALAFTAFRMSHLK
jgi:hypothetical protein